MAKSVCSVCILFSCNYWKNPAIHRICGHDDGYGPACKGTMFQNPSQKTTGPRRHSQNLEVNVPTSRFPKVRRWKKLPWNDEDNNTAIYKHAKFNINIALGSQINSDQSISVCQCHCLCTTQSIPVSFSWSFCISTWPGGTCERLEDSASEIPNLSFQDVPGTLIFLFLRIFPIKH